MLGSSPQRQEGERRSQSFSPQAGVVRSATLTKSLPTSPETVRKQACRRRFVAFGTISGTYKNPPCSRPWEWARLFAQGRPVSDRCEFTVNPNEPSRKQLESHLQAYRRRFRKLERLTALTKICHCSKPWAIAQAFCSKSADLGPLRIHTKSLRTSPQTVRSPFENTFPTF